MLKVDLTKSVGVLCSFLMKCGNEEIPEDCIKMPGNSKSNQNSRGPEIVKHSERNKQASERSTEK